MQAPLQAKDVEEYIYFYENACYNEAVQTQSHTARVRHTLRRALRHKTVIHTDR